MLFIKKVRNANLATLDITMLKTMKKKTNGVTSLHTSCMYDTLDQQKTWHNLLSPSLSLHGLVCFWISLLQVPPWSSIFLNISFAGNCSLQGPPQSSIFFNISTIVTVVFRDHCATKNKFHHNMSLQWVLNHKNKK